MTFHLHDPSLSDVRRRKATKQHFNSELSNLRIESTYLVEYKVILRIILI
jgi:hypothetical protein